MPTMLPTLMWCAGRTERGLEEQRARLVRCAPALVVRVEEPVSEELQLHVAKAVGLEDVVQLGEILGLEQVLEIGVPEPEPAEADARGMLAALAP